MILRFLLTGLISFFSIASFANDSGPETFKAWQGEIDIPSLEYQMSRVLGGSVDITSMRWTRNPLAYGAYFMGKLVQGLDGSFAEYVVDFELDRTHRVRCSFVMILNEDASMLRRCKSKTARVVARDFIYHKDIGLPYRQDYY